MIWLPNTKQIIFKFLFEYSRILKIVQATRWVMAIHEETIKGVRDTKRAMEKGVADVYMSHAPLVNTYWRGSTYVQLGGDGQTIGSIHHKASQQKAHEIVIRIIRN